MTRPRVVHLIDDTTAGGVMRVLDHIAQSREMAHDADHTVQSIRRGAISLRGLRADIIVSHLSISWATLPALLALRARHPKTPLVHVEHSYTKRFVELQVARPGRFAMLLRTAFALFDRVVAVSVDQAAWLESAGLVRLDKTIAIPSCVDLSAFRALPLPQDRPRIIGAIGRLDAQKGFDVLIRGFLQVHNPDLSLHIYGKGPEETQLRALAQGDDRIVFKGWSTNPTDPIANVDAVVMPSRWEAFGLVAIEALAAGRPLMTSGVDGLSDHTDFGARTVSSDTPAGWASALTLLTQSMTQALPTSPHRVSDLPERTFARSWTNLVQDLCDRPR